ncbi:hypothetical protein GCM10011369_04490 [Neiella marina]|uniref:Uncharacterized protein n=1 Tax=Neiella marina TaxID=508461 RepID=A0A8J2U2J6_9GAMM|nr:hypothetical protein GCM10011369_04490 [Neiella marina]
MVAKAEEEKAIVAAMAQEQICASLVFDLPMTGAPKLYVATFPWLSKIGARPLKLGIGIRILFECDCNVKEMFC